MDDVLDNAPCGYFSFTDDGKFCHVNFTLAELLGFDVSELKNEKVERIFSLSSKIFYQTHFFPLIKLQGRADEIFLTLSGKQKKELPVLVDAVRKLHEGQYINQVVCIPLHQRTKYEDEILHAKRKAEEALLKNEDLQQAKKLLEENQQVLDKRINELLYKNAELLQLNNLLAHDLQEPLRKIHLFADILEIENKEQLNEKSHRALVVIKDAAARMREVLDKLLEYMYLDTEPKNFSSIDLNAVLSKVVDRLQVKNSELNLSVTSEPLPVIEADNDQMELLFFHLLDNSVKFRHPERPVQITVTCDIIQENIYKSIEGKYRYEDFVKITVADNGIGLEMTYSNYIFMLLKKITPGRTGLGFGLPICKKIVEIHGGEISVQAEPGAGTSFIFLLPIQHSR